MSITGLALQAKRNKSERARKRESIKPVRVKLGTKIHTAVKLKNNNKHYFFWATILLSR